MLYDYSKLRGRIIEKFKTQKEFAKAMKCSQRTLSLKLNGRIYFSQYEIAKILLLLELKEDEIQDYFFTPEVQYC